MVSTTIAASHYESVHGHVMYDDNEKESDGFKKLPTDAAEIVFAVKWKVLRK